MLTDEQKFENKMKFMELLTKLGIDLTELSKYLDTVGYFESPYTAQYNGNYAGGLCEHALCTYYELMPLAKAYFNDRYSEETIIKVALFRDLYRAEMYTLGTRNVKNEATGKWEAVCEYKTKDVRPIYGDLGFSSYMIAKRFISLSDEEIEAICHSSYRDAYTGDIHSILKVYPLVTLARMAELAVNYLEGK